MHREKGFTLIELMIVIAIIAIIAAIAIPGLLSSQRAANERNASASLKTLATAESDFRSNDRDGNKVNDFWTGDVAGLFCMTSVSTPGNAAAEPPVKLIELSIAAADTAPLAAAAAGGEYRIITDFATQGPKSGYWYFALLSDLTVAVAAEGLYRQDTDATTTVPMGLVHNNSRFGFLAYPDAQGTSGKMAFMVNEANTMFKREPAQAEIIKPAGTPAAGLTVLAAYADWPTDVNLKSFWSKMD